jgi:hypothetical protein
MRRVAPILLACCLLPACGRSVPVRESSQPEAGSIASIRESTAIPASVFYAPGPAESFASLDREGVASIERRSRAAISADGTWTLSIEEAPQTAGEPRYELKTRLTLSRDEQGVYLHELFNASRGSTAVFTPPLRLMPAAIAHGSPPYAASASAKIAEGEGARKSVRNAKATAAFSVSPSDHAPTLVATTRLRITTGPAIIDRVAVMDLSFTDVWSVTTERRDFAVRVGPIAIESDSLVATPQGP